MTWLDEIIDDHWKKELQRIMEKLEPEDKERLFLVSFLHDQLHWSPIDIYTFIDLYNCWTGYNNEKTKRQVFRICDRKESGILDTCYENETQQQHTNFVGVPPTQSVGVFSGFPFLDEKHKGGIEIADIEVTKKFVKIANGHKYYQLVEKNWHKGSDNITFLSLESGRVLESEDGVKFFDKPEKFLSLPKSEEILNKLGEALTNYPKVCEDKKEKK